MKFSLQPLLRGAALFALALTLTACPSKKPKSDGSADGADGNSPPTIENQAMNFEAAGSDSGKISGLETINFAYDKSALTADAKKKIQGNVDWMKAHANINVQIEGHCDAKGSVEYNLALGDRRARAVKSYMTSLGAPASRLSVISYGKEKPLVQGDDESAYSKNRRANFVPLAQ